jgi:hypothetical protein
MSVCNGAGNIRYRAVNLGQRPRANPYERTSACCRCTLRLFRFRPGLPRLERRAPPPGQLWPEEEKAMGHSEHDPATKERHPWNVGRKVGAKRALKPQQVWAIRFWLDRERRLRDRAMFDLATDSKLRGCDVVKVKIGDLVSGSLLAKYGGGCRAGSARAANPCSNAIRRLRLAARDPPPWSRCAP